MVARIGVCDAMATGRYPIESTFVQRLEKHSESPRLDRLERVDQLIGGSHLTSCDDILNLNDHHWNDGHRLCDAGNFGDHADFHYLRFNLTEACHQPSAAGFGGNQYSRRPHQWVDNIALAKRELFDRSIDSGIDDGLVEFDLGLCQCRLSARLLRRENR